MTKIEVELEPEELADLEEFVKHHPKQFKNSADALKQMAGLKMYRKLKQSTDPERKKSPILGSDVGIPSYYPCALNEILESQGRTYQDFINDAFDVGIYLVQKALDSGNYEFNDKKQLLVKDISPQAIKWKEEHPGVMLVAEVETIKVKGEAK
jgi:hypothetical protein